MPIGTTPAPGWLPDTTAAAAATLASEEPATEALLAADAEMWGIVFAGGIGSRFWPLSSSRRPKQLLCLIGDRPLICESVGRLHPLIPAERVLVVTSADIAPAIHAAIPEVPVANMLVEPRPSGTAAALAWGAREVARRAGPNTLICALHADLAVAFPDAFRHTLQQAAGVAMRNDLFVAIGVQASRCETSFGYIVPGAPLAPDFPLDAGGPAMVERFVEKPNTEAAQALLDRQALWHSGICLARASVILDSLRDRTPEVAAVLDGADLSGHEASAGTVRSVSLERGLFERTDRLAVAVGEFGWDDVGTWASLRRARELDDRGNGAVGDVHFVDSSGNVVHAEGGSVAMFGVEGLLVVSLPGITFVTTMARAAELRALLDDLPEAVRSRKAPTSDVSTGQAS